MTAIVILGRQPKLGLAELESLYDANTVTPLGDQAATVTTALTPKRMGGVLKVAKPIAEIPHTDWRRIDDYIIKAFPDLIRDLPEGKLKLGLSAYDLRVDMQQMFRTGLELKKACRAQKRSVRIVPNNTSPELNSAAVLYNGLIGELGIELLFIRSGRSTWLAQTTWAQDIDAYAKRDFDRPARDAFVGMLPPKLAQIMLNMAKAQPGQRILDPFCGTGVVLQEALLMGCDVYGTDINPRMVEFTQKNMAWLQDTYLASAPRTANTIMDTEDATNATWEPPIDHVVCETYLGQPLSGLPKPEKLQQIITDCDTIISKFLKNLHPQLVAGTPLCIAVPAWRVGGQFKHLSLLDRLGDLGYNRTRFKYASWDELIYHREDQIVARELLVLTVK